MSPWLWLAAWFAGLLGSIAAHEAAHVVAGRIAGWAYGGVFLSPRALGIGVRLEPREGTEGRLWAIAAAGPVASLAAMYLFWVLAGAGGIAAVVCYSLAAMNLTIALINLLPTPITDGGHIVASALGRRPSWSGFAAWTFGIWIVAEIVTAVFLLL